MTKSQSVAKDIAALFRARNVLLWVVTREESRVEKHLIEAAAAAGYVPRTWDAAQGVARIDGSVEPIGGPDIGDTLNAIKDRSNGQERGAWILRDVPGWLSPPIGLVPLRQMRNLAKLLPTTKRESAQAMVVITPVKDVPLELTGHATVIEWPMPDREEIAAILDVTINSLPEEIRAGAAPNGTREAAIDAAVGLSGEEAQACYAQSLVKFRKIDPVVVAKEKRRVIARERVLEWFDPIPGGLESVGGLDVLKSWLVQRKSSYSKAAREYGLPAPKGVLLVGISGCGKSLTAKAVATAWGVPLLRLDLGALRSKFVGESEGNIRKAFDVIQAIGRCVVWLDEVEKALQGATSGSADGGVSSDALGAILSWMQDRSGEAFIVATCNDVSGLPPEFLRKGRFDELFFVDLPNKVERREVLKAALKSHGRGEADVDLIAVGDACEGFTGSEIAALVPDSLFAAFNDGAREIATDDLLAAAKTVVPLSKTAEEKISTLRNWANGRARNATSQVEVTATSSQNRVLDL
jgi:hypothetical protein